MRSISGTSRPSHLPTLLVLQIFASYSSCGDHDISHKTNFEMLERHQSQWASSSEYDCLRRVSSNIHDVPNVWSGLGAFWMTSLAFLIRAACINKGGKEGQSGACWGHTPFYRFSITS